MENKYRNMMDEVRAPETLRESVMEITERERTKKTRPTPARVLLAAACVCALLVVGVVAAEIVRNASVQISRGTGKNSNSFYFSLGGEAIPLEEFSPELQALAEPYWNTGYHAEHLSFDSWEEAENFLGRKIMDNPILAESEYSGYGITYEEKHIEGNCIVAVMINGTFGRIWLDAEYDIYLEGVGGREVLVEAHLLTESNLEGPPLALESAINEVEPSPEETDQEQNTAEYIALEPESYQTANGFEAEIFDLPYFKDDGTHDWGRYCGYIYPHGIQFEVSSFYSGQEDKEMALSAIKKVLDNFQ